MDETLCEVTLHLLEKVRKVQLEVHLLSYSDVVDKHADDIFVVHVIPSGYGYTNHNV